MTPCFMKEVGIARPRGRWVSGTGILVGEDQVGVVSDILVPSCSCLDGPTPPRVGPEAPCLGCAWIGSAVAIYKATHFGRSQSSPCVLMAGSGAELPCSLRAVRIACNRGERACPRIRRSIGMLYSGEYVTFYAFKRLTVHHQPRCI